VILARATKDPNASLPYSISWAAWLEDLTGESIATATWAIDSPPDSSLTLGASSLSGSVATVRVNGGTVGESYRVRCRVTTAPTGYIDDRTIEIRIEER
jgi:hypothetical protein